MKNFIVTLICPLLVALFLSVLPASAQVDAPDLAEKGAAQLEECFGLSPADAQAILDEPVQEEWSQDENYGYCVYASAARSSTRASADLLPTYGPVGQHRYVAATVWPVGSATDPFMYLAFAILDRDHGKFGDFLAQEGMTALEELTLAEISAQTLSRQFLPDLGDGALWYWQETATDEHLAGIYALHGEQRVVVQALVGAERSADDVLDAMRLLVEELIAANTRPTAPAPRVVDGCPHFTQFDAAAILQEPVRGDEPIGNLFFGPLPAWAAEEGMDQVLRGLCGYVNLSADQAALAGAELPASAQTHLATQIDANHAVVATHLTAEISHSTAGTFSTDWFDLILLVQVLAAADPERADASFDALYAAYESGDVTPVLPLLYENAQADPSFKATEMPLPDDDPRNEMLWLWQTLEDGYFSLLISRQGMDFDLVAARLGAGMTEKTVLGYSQVVLGKLVDAHNDAAVLSAGCDRLSLETVEAIVGEPVRGTPVANAQGEGCKYTPVEDDLTIDSADFSSQFQTFGLLAGLVPPKAAQEMLFGMVEELANDGEVTDGEALGEVLAAIEAEDFASALSGMAALEWNSNSWTVEALTEEGDETLFVHGKTGNGWPQFFLLQNRAEGDLDYLTGVLRLEIDEVRPAIVAAASQLAAPLPAGGETSAGSSTILGCSWVTPEQASAILGRAVQGKAVVGERGDGCKYVPAAEFASVTPDDFSPGFDSYGLLAGFMPLEAAQWFLGQLNDDMEMSESDHGDLAAAIEEGDIAQALAVVGSQESTTTEWQIETLSAGDADVIWLSVEVEDGTFLSFFMLAAADVLVDNSAASAPGMWIIAVQLAPQGDVAAMRDAALVALAELPVFAAP